MPSLNEGKNILFLLYYVKLYKVYPLRSVVHNVSYIGITQMESVNYVSNIVVRFSEKRGIMLYFFSFVFMYYMNYDFFQLTYIHFSYN